MAAVGIGMGAALATAASAALGELSAERAGIGSAVMQTVQKIGAPFGAAILGSVLNAGYRGHLDLAGLPAPAAEAARDSVFAAIVLARKLHSSSLLESARTSFVHGMDVMLVVCGGIAVAGIVLALLFFPRRKVAPEGRGRQVRLERERAA
jgi:MFS transporter, DHA2 family, multidrug resistance protein